MIKIDEVAIASQLNESLNSQPDLYTKAGHFFSVIHRLNVQNRSAVDLEAPILPDLEDLPRLISNLDTICVLVKDESTSFFLPSSPNSITYLVFDDLSAIAYQDDEPCDLTLHIQDTNFSITMLATEDRITKFIASSKGFVDAFGPVSDWVKKWKSHEARGPDGLDDYLPCIFDELEEALLDVVDPLIQEGSLTGHISWDDDDVSNIEDTLQQIAAAVMNPGEKIRITILSSTTEEAPATVTVHDDSKPLERFEALQAIIGHIVDLDDLYGYSMEYNETGSGERMSSYSEASEHVADLRFNQQLFTGHFVIEQRIHLAEKLTEITGSKAYADALILAAQNCTAPPCLESDELLAV